MYVTNCAMVEAYRKCAHMHAKALPQHTHSHRGTTGPEHAKHEKRWVKREPRKYVTCHAAHAGRTTNEGGQRGVWSRVECK